MLDPNIFRERWNLLEENAFVTYAPIMFDGVDVPYESITFLLEAGLPDSAAPFLNMHQPSLRPLPSVAQSWNLTEDFNRYWEIGTDGGGNPLCIEEGNGNIILLDHDNLFSPLFVNTNVISFAECILTYREFVRNVRNVNGENAFLEGNIPAPLKRQLAEDLLHIDRRTVEDNGFWHQELLDLEL